MNGRREIMNKESSMNWFPFRTSLRLTRIGTLLAVMAMASASAHAQEGWRDLKSGLCIPDCVRKWCCDDYCSKPLPCRVNVQCFGCDTYDCKKLPCPRNVSCFRRDDYCPKPYPCFSCPTSPFLKCTPASQGRKAPTAAASTPVAKEGQAVRDRSMNFLQLTDLSAPDSPLR
jgi:hypothetical protein